MTGDDRGMMRNDGMIFGMIFVFLWWPEFKIRMSQGNWQMCRGPAEGSSL